MITDLKTHLKEIAMWYQQNNDFLRMEKAIEKAIDNAHYEDDWYDNLCPDCWGKFQLWDWEYMDKFWYTFICHKCFHEKFDIIDWEYIKLP